MVLKRVAIGLLPLVLVGLIGEAIVRLAGYQSPLEFFAQSDDVFYELPRNYEGNGPQLYGIPRDIPLITNTLVFRGPEASE